MAISIIAAVSVAFVGLWGLALLPASPATIRAIAQVLLYRLVHIVPARLVLNSGNPRSSGAVDTRQAVDGSSSSSSGSSSGGSTGRRARRERTFSADGRKVTVSAQTVAHDLRRAALTLRTQFMDATTGLFDYKAMKASAAFAEYERVAHQLQRVDVVSLGPRNSARRMAFLINVYNALNIHATLVARPTKLVQKLALLQSASYIIAGQALSLDEIENGLLRGNRKPPMSLWPVFMPWDRRRSGALNTKDVDPRIHFALNCGAKSCPLVRVYSADKLDKQLNLAAKSFCSQSVEVDAASLDSASLPTVVRVSPIFLWYRVDFGGTTASILRHIAAYLKVGRQSGQSPHGFATNSAAPDTLGAANSQLATVMEALAASHAQPSLKAMPYDWSLNEQAPTSAAR